MRYSIHYQRFIKFQLPAILWAAIIYISSSIPTAKLPSVDFPSFDKGVHFIIFFTLAALTHRAVRFQNRVPFAAKHHVFSTVLLVVLYGLVDEFHQYFVPGRNPSVLDLIADAIGALIYLALFFLVQWLHSSKSPD